MAAIDPFNFGNYGLVALTLGNQASEVQGDRVTANFFHVLGVQPVLGRSFTPEEDRAGVAVVVLSHGLWQREFNADPEILGREIVLDDKPYGVVGVMPKQFRYRQHAFSSDTDLWLTGLLAATPASNRLGGELRAIARLKPGVSPERARAEMAVITERLAKAYPKEDKDIELVAIKLLDVVTGQQRSELLLFLAAVGLVLLIACANVANLLLARAGVRRREIAIRTAIGAGRGRLVRQLFTESVLLALAGGLGGLALAFASTGLFRLFLPDTFRLDEAGIDLRVLGFTALLSLISAMVFGLAPALQASKTELDDMLRDSARSVSTSRGSARLRRALVVLQMAMSLVLLAGAGLMINSFWRLHQIHLGFDPNRVLTAQCILPKSPRYVTAEGFKKEGPGGSMKLTSWALNQQAIDFPEQVVARIEKLPGVKSAAASVCGLPLRRSLGYRFSIEGQGTPTPDQAERMSATRFLVTSGYFRTLGMRLLDGREFNELDEPAAPRVVIVNRVLARTFWPRGSRVIGQRILFGTPPQPYQIVGIVDDVRLWPRQEFHPQLYFPQMQTQQPWYAGVAMNLRLELYFVVRTRSDPSAEAAAVVAAIHEIDPEQPVGEMRTMDEVVTKALGPWRSTMLLIGIFAAVAVLLAAVGIYGVISYIVTQRTHEIGVRMALGASRAKVIRLVMRDGLWLALPGTLIGVGASYALTRLIAGQLYGVTATDPVTFGAVAMALFVIAMLTCYVPARRAARQDPVAALRNE